MVSTSIPRTSTSIVPTPKIHFNGKNGDGSYQDGLYVSTENKLSKSFVLTPVGLVVEGSPSITEWLHFGEAIRRYTEAIQWCIGDWLNYGERAYGDMYTQALEATDYEYGTLANFAWTAKHIEFSLRSENLTFSHHKEVAPLMPDEQEYWLKLAEKGDGEKRWSVATLRAAIRDSITKEHPSWIKHTDVWNFTACDERFGVDYPGRIPGQIVLNVLHYYTQKGDLVIDPMAGGGVTIDACRELKRDCIAFDLYPHRSDIVQGDASATWPTKRQANLVFIDPPYSTQMRESYGGVAQLPYAEFLAAMAKVFEQAKKHLHSDGILALLIAPIAIQADSFLDVSFDFVSLCKDMNFEYMRRISVPVSSQQVGPQVTANRRDNNELVALIRDLLIFRKGE